MRMTPHVIVKKLIRRWSISSSARCCDRHALLVISWFTTMSQKNVSDNGSDWCSDTTRRRDRPRNTGRRGGGVGVLINNRIKHQSRILHDKPEITSFESIELVITVSSVTIRLSVIYRMPPVKYKIKPQSIRYQQAREMVVSDWLTRRTDLCCMISKSCMISKM